MPRTVLIALTTLAGSAVAAAAPTAATQRERADVVSTSMLPLVKSIRVSGFGRVMATRKARRSTTGRPRSGRPGRSSAPVRAPCLARPVRPKGTVVQRKYPGYKGVFGTIRRPNGSCS